MHPWNCSEVVGVDNEWGALVDAEARWWVRGRYEQRVDTRGAVIGRKSDLIRRRLNTKSSGFVLSITYVHDSPRNIAFSSSGRIYVV